MLFENEITHAAAFPWQLPLAQGEFELMLQIKEGKARSVTVYVADPCDYAPAGTKNPNLRPLPMKRRHRGNGQDTFYCRGQMKTHKLRYHFEIEDGEGRFLFSESGCAELGTPDAGIRPFFISYTFAHQVYQAPAWVEDVVWYQIFPERYYTGSDQSDWQNFVPQRENRFGGTLAGILDKLDTIQQLGVQGLYLNPVFASPSNHKYDAADYLRVDEAFGTREDLIRLANALHSRGMRLMLDGVFNHCSWDHPHWLDVAKNGSQSPYYDWFVVYDEALLRGTPREELTAEFMKRTPPYECFAFAANMPKWNTHHPEVQAYLIDAAEYWTRLLQVDAWRLDVPDEVSRDFLRRFRQRMKALCPDIYITGEIWSSPAAWLGGDAFDGVMHYAQYFALRDFLLTGGQGAKQFAHRLSQSLTGVPPAVQKEMLTFCANHDIPRPMSLAQGHKGRFCCAYVLAALLPGSLCLYYGDEIGMEGGEDPDNRRAMRWDGGDGEIYSFFRDLLAFRKTQGLHRHTPCQIQVLSQQALRLGYDKGARSLYVNASNAPLALPVVHTPQILFGNLSLTQEALVIPPWGYGMVQ